jgi:polyferredoxin
MPQDADVRRKLSLGHVLPLLVGCAVAALLYWLSRWWGFILIFTWIGGWITLGQLFVLGKEGQEKDLGRRIAILAISPIFLVFLGILQRENLQLEETVFYLSIGYFSRVLIHYAIAKIFGPLIWGRGFCGWACWTAAFLEWLPIKENRPIPRRFTYLRIPVFVLSLLIPYLFVASGYDFIHRHLAESLGKWDQFLWFAVGNGVYYLLAIPLAFLFRKRRAFCKILCPVSLVMKGPTKLALIRQKPSGATCTECGSCNDSCPMDVDVIGYISRGKSVGSSECILCGLCQNVCPQGAIK